MKERPRGVEPHSFDEPIAALTRRRPLTVVPRHLRLEVTLAPPLPGEPLRVAGRVTHRVIGLHPETHEVTLDAADQRILAATRDGTPCAFRAVAAGVSLSLSPPIRAGETVELALDFEATPSAGLYAVGPTPERPGLRPQLWTQGAMEDHHHWFPCFDAPEHVVTTEVHATVPDGLQALSNGQPLGKAPAEDRPGYTTWRWHQAKPHALYLLTLVVDDVVEVVDTAPGATLHHFVPRGREADARALFERMPAMVRFFAELTGQPYPFGRYGHVFLQEFMWGGMENTTLTSLTDQVLVEGRHRDEEDVERLFAHELAHQWFGDLIAPRGWAEIWLNESFATYLEVLCMGDLNGPDDAERRRQQLRDNYLAEAAGRYARAVVTRRFAHPYVLFDRHAYEKGALVLHTLRDQLGDAPFLAGVRDYVSRCAGRAAETAELRRAFEDASGEDLTDFFEAFVYGAGHPRLSVTWRHLPGAGVELILDRTDDGPGALMLTVALGRADGKPARLRVPMGPGRRSVFIPAEAAPLWLAVDPEAACLVEIDEADEDDAPLRARLADAHAPTALRARTCRLLSARGTSANRQALAETLRHDAAEWVRAEAATALGELRQAAARTALRDALDAEPAWRVRAAAARALGVGGDAAQLTEISTRLGSEPSHRVRCGYLRALGDVPTPEARALLRGALEQTSPRECVAATALSALAAHEEASAIDELLPRTSPAFHRAVRVAAIGGLSRVAAAHTQDRALQRRVRLHVEGLLGDATYWVRSAALDALRELGDAAAIPALERAHGAETFASLRRTAREAIGALQARAAGAKDRP